MLCGVLDGRFAGNEKSSKVHIIGEQYILVAVIFLCVKCDASIQFRDS